MQARTDFLTGLYNRRHFVELAQRELVRCTRYQRPLTLVMIDIDHFKVINDTWGHHIGDLVLQRIANLMRETLRNVDIFGRTGGEEFAAALIESDTTRALAVAASSMALDEGGPVQVTISIGLATLQARDLSLERLLNEADRALYRAKQAGRNRVQVETPGATASLSVPPIHKPETPA